jgi:hypothetical protein
MPQAGSPPPGVGHSTDSKEFRTLFEEVSKLKLQFATLQEQRRSVGDEWITVYVGVKDGNPIVFNESDALAFAREQVYTTTRAPYLQRWERDPSDGEWIRMEETWEELESD